ncbi:MAG: YchF family ATPase [Candidatus Latescibacteria bacterium]|nr:YchF family ATPase [Candidatus Latescibacterota bacterium]
MRIGIIGLPQTGKKTLFSLLVGPAALSGHTDARAAARGMADVRDPRFDRLVEMYRPKRQVRARLEVVLCPSIEEKSLSEGEALQEIADVDALCHVVRVFEDDSVYHIWGKPDPKREVEFLHGEMVLHDLVFIEKRLERIDKNLKKGKDDRAEKEKTLLARFREALEKERPLRTLAVSPEDATLIASYPFLTLRAIIVALNVSDEAIADTRLRDALGSAHEPMGASVVQIAVRAESEIAALDDPAERGAFMQDLGIETPALHLLTSKCIEALGLMSFFTVGEDEVRQWFVRRGATAPEAAGVIHSDLQRGFIRAEVMKYADLIAAGSEEKLKTTGKYYLKGKDYVVEDGDILTIRFNV